MSCLSDVCGSYDDLMNVGGLLGHTGDLNVTGLRPPVVKDLYAMCCWSVAQNNLNLLSWLLTYLCNN